jgi:hypothetical protein
MSGHLDLVPVSKDLRARLKAEIKRTGVTGLRLCRMQEGLPPSGMVNRWMKGIVFEARKIEVEAVLAAYEALPNIDVALKPRAGRRHEKVYAPRIPVTTEIGNFVRSELVRTGLNAELIAARMPQKDYGARYKGVGL